MSPQSPGTACHWSPLMASQHLLTSPSSNHSVSTHTSSNISSISISSDQSHVSQHNHNQCLQPRSSTQLRLMVGIRISPMPPLPLPSPLCKAMDTSALQRRHLHPPVIASAQAQAHSLSRRTAQESHQPQGEPGGNCSQCCMPFSSTLRMLVSVVIVRVYHDGVTLYLEQAVNQA